MGVNAQMIDLLSAELYRRPQNSSGTISSNPMNGAIGTIGAPCAAVNFEISRIVANPEEKYAVDDFSIRNNKQASVFNILL